MTLHGHVPCALVGRAPCRSARASRGARTAQRTDNGVGDGAAALRQPLQLRGVASGSAMTKTDVNTVVFKLPMKEALLKLQMFIFLQGI